MAVIDESENITEVEEFTEVEEVSEEVTEVTEQENPQETEVVVQIGEDSPPQEEAAPEWVRNLRKEYREEKRKRQELEQRLTQQVDAPKLPNRPKLEEFDYDEDKFQTAIDDWYSQKAKFDELERKKVQEREEAQKRVQEVHQTYKEKASAIGVKDFQEAEDEVVNALSEAQQGIILSGADNSALVVYALGKNAKRLSELAQIKDPVKFAVAIGKLEKDLKVTNRRVDKPAPDTPIRSSAPGTSSTLEKLRAEAERTGDYSKVLEWKRKNR